MTYPPVEVHPWPLRRWGEMIVLVFGIQLGLIFWLGSTAPIHPRPTAAGVTLQFAGAASAELRALNDPTLFTLPHPHGFSGPEWLRMPRVEFRSYEWPIPTDQLFQALDRFKPVFRPFAEASDVAAVQLPAQPEVEPTLPDLPLLPVLPDHSVLQLEGDLARRRLLVPLELKSQRHSAILAKSVVQVAVDAEGRPVSVTLLSESGLAEADQYALEQAKAARFERMNLGPAEGVSSPIAPLSWGKMIFRWHTFPILSGSGAAASP